MADVIRQSRSKSSSKGDKAVTVRQEMIGSVQSRRLRAESALEQVRQRVTPETVSSKRPRQDPPPCAVQPVSHRRFSSSLNNSTEQTAAQLSKGPSASKQLLRVCASMG